MKKLIECVPNFSEGRRPEVIEAIVKEILTVSGIKLLDKEMDKDHNRAVVTFIGEPEPVKQAAFKAIAKATQLIDMEKHKGEHPRLGATDVVPFVPISGTTMHECVILARQLGQEVAEKLNIPVYLYEAAATRPDRQNLAAIRKGEYEGLKQEIQTNPDKKPDFGPGKLHPSAGAVVIGARMPLIAYNVYLGTRDVTVAKKIASAIRFAAGGYRYVKALGFEIKERGLTQVSMNLVNYQGTPIFRVFETVKREAARYGVPVISSEIVGLTPAEALYDVADFYLQLENFSREQVLETKLLDLERGAEKSIHDFLNEVASSAPAPGGGSVSALAGSLSGALSAMVCNLTIGKAKYEVHREELSSVLEKANQLQRELEELIILDSESFNSVMQALKLSKTTPEEVEKREKTLQEAYHKATSIPLKVMQKSLQALELAQITADKGNVNSVSDAGVAALLGKSAVEGAYFNVLINLPSLKDENFKSQISSQAGEIMARASELSSSVLKTVNEKLGCPTAT